MVSVAPDWSAIGEHARTALNRLDGLAAKIQVELGDNTDGPERISVVYANPGTWSIWEGEQLSAFHDTQHHISRSPSGELIAHRAIATWFPARKLYGLGWGHPRLFLDPADYERPVAGPTPTSHLGRPAWEADLDSPSKSAALRVVIDADTGLVLKYTNLTPPMLCVSVVELAINDTLGPNVLKRPDYTISCQCLQGGDCTPSTDQVDGSRTPWARDTSSQGDHAGTPLNRTPDFYFDFSD